MSKYISNKEKDKQIINVSKREISELINIALASAKINKITLKQKKGDFELRPNIHIFLYGEKSSTKSTFLKEISNKTMCKSAYTHMTFPALVGSIDRDTKQIISGACWECRNKFLLLDEFDFNQRNKELIRALLQLMEGGLYSRKLSSFAVPSNETDEDLYFNFKSGEFSIKTRFSLILATMKYPYNTQNLEVQALISRCITIPIYLEKNDLMDIAEGEPIFTYEEISILEKDIIIKSKDYEKILNYVEKHTGLNQNNFLRIIGDCSRIFAVLGEHREDLYDIIVKLGGKEFSQYSKYK